MTIYIDVLLVVNLYINYFLIRGASQLLREDISTKRCLLSASVGAVFAVVIVMPQLPFLVTLLIRLLSCVFTTLAAFGFKNTADFIISLLCLMVIGFLYSGLMLCLWNFAAPMGMYFNNGAAYFDIPIIAIALFTIISYGILRFWRYVSDRKNTSAVMEKITVKIGDTAVTVKGLADTGNSLSDPFSGKSVILCSRNAIAEVIPSCITEYLDKGNLDSMAGLRLIPCSTIGGKAVIPVFSADEIIIGSRKTEAEIGVCDNEIAGADCLFNPKIMI